MVNTSAWPTLLLLAALQHASAVEIGGYEITEDYQEISGLTEASCPRLSAQSRSLFLALAEDPTCASSSRTDSTCYNNHCRVCYTKLTDLNKNFDSCASLVPTAAPAPVVSTAPPSQAPPFDPSSLDEPTTSPTADAPTDAPTEAPPSETPWVPSDPWVPTTAPVAPPDVPTDLPTAAPWTDTVWPPTDDPVTTLPVSITPTLPTSETPSGLPTDEPWTPTDPTFPTPTSEEPPTGGSSDAAVDADFSLDSSRDADASSDSSSSSGSSSSLDMDASSSGSSSGSNAAPVPDLCDGKLSPGDRDGGVRVITDTNCIGGGLGCFDFVCRFCKIQETDVAADYFKCSSFGYHFDGDELNNDDDNADGTTDAPSVTDEPSQDGDDVNVDGSDGSGSGSGVDARDCFKKLSVGDYEASIRTIPDAKCLYGGLGCFDLACRYCKIGETDKSKHMFKCVDFGYHFVGDEFSDGSGSIDEPKPTVAPPTETEAPVDASADASADGSTTDGSTTDGSTTDGSTAEEPTDGSTDGSAEEPSAKPSDEPTVVPTKEPTQEPTQEPTAEPTDEPTAEPTTEPPTEPSGQPIAEPTDASTDAPTAEPTDAPAPTCDIPVSDGDARAGINMVTDASCVSGGLGCFGDLCRMCKVQATEGSNHLAWCTDVLAAIAAATTTAPAVAATAPVTATTAPVVWVPTGACAALVSPGDRGASISAVSGTDCSSDGLGCFADNCRYCKLGDTPTSSHLLPCAQFAPKTEAVMAVAPLFQAAAAVASETSSELGSILQNKSFKWSLVGLAFVGAVAAVALAAVGVTRAVRRIANPTIDSATDEDEEDDDDAEADDAVEDVEAPPSQESARALGAAVDWSNDSAVLSTA